jgi:hypothetical protein
VRKTGHAIEEVTTLGDSLANTGFVEITRQPNRILHRQHGGTFPGFD